MGNEHKDKDPSRWERHFLVAPGGAESKSF